MGSCASLADPQWAEVEEAVPQIRWHFDGEELIPLEELRRLPTLEQIRRKKKRKKKKANVRIYSIKIKVKKRKTIHFVSKTIQT